MAAADDGAGVAVGPDGATAVVPLTLPLPPSSRPSRACAATRDSRIDAGMVTVADKDADEDAAGEADRSLRSAMVECSDSATEP